MRQRLDYDRKGYKPCAVSKSRRGRWVWSDWQSSLPCRVESAGKQPKRIIWWLYKSIYIFIIALWVFAQHRWKHCYLQSLTLMCRPYYLPRHQSSLTFCSHTAAKNSRPFRHRLAKSAVFLLDNCFYKKARYLTVEFLNIHHMKINRTNQCIKTFHLGVQFLYLEHFYAARSQNI